MLTIGDDLFTCGVSKQTLKHFSRICSKFGDNPNQNYPVSEQRRHRISGLVGVLRRFWEFPNPEIGFRPLPSLKSNRAGEIEPFRTIWVSLPESRLFQGLINRFYYLSDCATGYKWTVTCVLVYEICQREQRHVSE